MTSSSYKWRAIIFGICLATISGCSTKSVTLKAAHTRNGKIEVTVSRDDAIDIIRSNYVVYIGAGGCDGSDDIVGVASINGQSLPNSDLLPLISSEAGDVVLSAPFSGSPEPKCAYLHLNSMLPQSIKVKPIQITP